MVKFLGERVIYVGRTETERKPYQFRLSIRNVESTHENPYGLLVSSVEQGDVHINQAQRREPKSTRGSVADSPPIQ